MVTVRDIFSVLDALAPVESKMEFDNVGLLVGSMDSTVTKVLLSLDIIDDVIAEAEGIGAELIVSHHPLTFGIKSVTGGDLIGRKILALAKGGISAICMHTNLDKASGGVNDALSDILGLVDAEPFGEEGMGRAGYVPEQSLNTFMNHVKSALHANGLRFVDAGRPVKHVAVLGGAGGGELMDAYNTGADTYVTADVKHNQFIDARELGINLIDAGHFSTENVVIPVLSELITDKFPELDVRISEVNAQPEHFF